MFKYLLTFCLLTSFVQGDLLAKDEKKSDKKASKKSKKKESQSVSGSKNNSDYKPSFGAPGNINVGHGTGTVGESSFPPVFGGDGGLVFRKGDDKTPGKKRKSKSSGGKNGSFDPVGDIGHGSTPNGGGKKGGGYTLGGDHTSGNDYHGGLTLGGDRYGNDSTLFNEQAVAIASFVYKESGDLPVSEGADELPSQEPERSPVYGGNDTGVDYDYGSSGGGFSSPDGGNYGGFLGFSALKKEAKKKLERLKFAVCEYGLIPAHAY